jgi:hypothetical protein
MQMISATTATGNADAGARQRMQQHHALLLFVVLTAAFIPMHAFVVPSILQSQQAHYTSSTRLQEKKRTKSSGGGFGNVVKDILSSSSTTAPPNTFPFTGTVRPGKQSPQRIVMDESIVKPDYWQSGVPLKTKKGLLPWMIEVKTSEEIVKMKQAGVLARHILDMAGRAVRPGITTDEIDTMVHDEIIKVRMYVCM